MRKIILVCMVWISCTPGRQSQQHLTVASKTKSIRIADMIGEQIVSIDSTKDACEGRLVTKDRYGYNQYDHIPMWFFKVYKVNDIIK